MTANTPPRRKEWVEDIASRKVDYEDFEEVAEMLKSIEYH